MPGKTERLLPAINGRRGRQHRGVLDGWLCPQPGIQRRQGLGRPAPRPPRSGSRRRTGSWNPDMPQCAQLSLTLDVATRLHAAVQPERTFRIGSFVQRPSTFLRLSHLLRGAGRSSEDAPASAADRFPQQQAYPRLGSETEAYLCCTTLGRPEFSARPLRLLRRMKGGTRQVDQCARESNGRHTDRWPRRGGSCLPESWLRRAQLSEEQDWLSACKA